MARTQKAASVDAGRLDWGAMQDVVVSRLLVHRTELEKRRARADGRITGALFDALSGRLDRMLAFARQSSNPQEFREQTESLLQEMTELQKWIFPERPRWDDSREDSAGDFLSAMGLPYSPVRKIIRRSRRLAVGAPASQRGNTIRAMELRQAGKTWREVADNVCDCWRRDQKKPHEAECAERLRVSVNGLEIVLRRLKVHTPG